MTLLILNYSKFSCYSIYIYIYLEEIFKRRKKILKAARTQLYSKKKVPRMNICVFKRSTCYIIETEKKKKIIVYQYVEEEKKGKK